MVAVLAACGSNGKGGAGSGLVPLSNSQQPAGNTQQPPANTQQPSGNAQQPPGNTQTPGGSTQVASGGINCDSACAQISAAGCDAADGQCATRCPVTRVACAAEIQALLDCVAGSACMADGNFSAACQPVYANYVGCESALVGNGGSGGDTGAGGGGGNPPPPEGGTGGGATGGTCTLQGDSCAGCATLCDICACAGDPPAQCGC
ncbi:MAG TPA: hypothetical protein VGI10_29230 [Polyangiaceae bacterium]